MTPLFVRALFHLSRLVINQFSVPGGLVAAAVIPGAKITCEDLGPGFDLAQDVERESLGNRSVLKARAIDGSGEQYVVRQAVPAPVNYAQAEEAALQLLIRIYRSFGFLDKEEAAGQWLAHHTDRLFLASSLDSLRFQIQERNESQANSVYGEFLNQLDSTNSDELDTQAQP